MSEAIAREATATTVTVPQEPKRLATITAYPDHVCVDFDFGRDGEIAPDVAEEIGNALIAAAAESRSIEWAADDWGLSVIDKA